MTAIATTFAAPSLRRVAYAALTALLLAATAVEAVKHGLWAPALAGLVAPDLALAFGGGRGLARGQLHPRAVGLYNAVHRFWGPFALLAAAALALAGLGWFVAGLAWATHVALDRAVGYGLRDRAGFQAVTTRQLEILGAARELLAREGVEALTVGRLAESLGIKAPSLYKHFSGKRELEAHLIADGLRAHAEALEGAGSDLAAIAAAYRAFALAQPQLYRLMTERPLPREDLPEGLEARAAAPLIAALGDPDLARAAWAYAHGMVELELAGRFPPGADLDAAWRKAVAAFAAAA